jgi:hypothetical protein
LGQRVRQAVGHLTRIKSRSGSNTGNMGTPGQAWRGSRPA